MDVCWGGSERLACKLENGTIRATIRRRIEWPRRLNFYISQRISRIEEVGGESDGTENFSRCTKAKCCFLPIPAIPLGGFMVKRMSLIFFSGVLCGPVIQAPSIVTALWYPPVTLYP